MYINEFFLTLQDTPNQEKIHSKQTYAKGFFRKLCFEKFV